MDLSHKTNIYIEGLSEIYARIKKETKALVLQ